MLGLASLLPASGWLKLRLVPWQALTAAGWAGCLLMVWSSAGLLFDVLRMGGGAGFPGLPPVVDWTGFTQRAVSLLGAVMLFACTVRFRREATGACLSCGSTSGRAVPARNPLAYAALVFACAYPLLKMYEVWGRPLGGGQSVSAHPAYGELVLLAGSVLLSIALASRWGRRLPRRTVLAAGCAAAVLTVPAGLLAVVGAMMQAPGLPVGPVRLDGGGTAVMLAYGVWLGYGISTAAATWVYAMQTRRACTRCGGG